MKANVLIIEDDHEIGELVGLFLNEDGIDYTLVATAEEGLAGLRSATYHLIVLDINLPGMDGFEALQEIRRDSNIPVVIISARKSDEDNILGLGLGADDFVSKPFSPKVLVARIRANLRRYQVEKKGDRPILAFLDFEMDIDKGLLKKGGIRLPLGSKEFAILAHLIKHAGSPVSMKQIHEEVWETKSPDPTSVAVYIKRLRKKLQDDSSKSRIIQTVHGYGYSFSKELLKDS